MASSTSRSVDNRAHDAAPFMLPSYADLARSKGSARGAAPLLSRLVGFYFTGKSSPSRNDAIKQAVDSSNLNYCLPADDYNITALKTLVVFFRLCLYYGHFEDQKDWSNTIAQDSGLPRFVVEMLLHQFVAARNGYVALYGSQVPPDVSELDGTLCELVDAYIGRTVLRFIMTSMRKQYISATRIIWKQEQAQNPRFLLTNTPRLPSTSKQDWIEGPKTDGGQTSHDRNEVPRDRSLSPHRQTRQVHPNHRVRSPVRRVATSGTSSNQLRIKPTVANIQPKAAELSISTGASTPSSSRPFGRAPLTATNLGQRASHEAGPSKVTPLQGTTPQRTRLQVAATGPEVALRPPIALARIEASSATNLPAEMGAGNNNPQNSIVQGAHGQNGSSSIQGKKEEDNEDRVNNDQGHNAPLHQDAERNPTQHNGGPMEYLDIVKTALVETKKFLNRNDLSPAIKADITFQVKQYEVVAAYAVDINNRTKGQRPDGATDPQINSYTDIIMKAHGATKRFAEGFGVAAEVYGLILTQVKQYKIMAAYAQKIEDLMNQ